MFIDAGRSIPWGSGRGVGTGNLEFCGRQMALAYWLDAIPRGPQNSRFPMPAPLPLPHNVSARNKNITQGAVEILGA